LNDDPRQVLADRLRSLREGHGRGRKITQHQLAQALGGAKPVSVPLISGWESMSSPKIPATRWIELYAVIFATTRSFEGPQPGPIADNEMTDEERRRMSELRQELTRLRNDARRAQYEADRASGPAADTVAAPETAVAGGGQVARSIQSGPWRFGEREVITLVCAQLPPELRAKQVYANPDDPDYISLYTYSELDALFELYGHLRAANPLSRVDLRLAHELSPDVYSSHLVSLGGTDWNLATRSVLRDLRLPVRQVANWGMDGTDDNVYFEVEDEDGRASQHRPIFEKSADGRNILLYDVALFARAVNPFNRKRTVTICNGMYGRGTYGVVRTLTDPRFRDRNAEYLTGRFGSSESYCLLTRVPIVDAATLTPDWSSPDSRLFEWSAS
jgi:transcriptional regulator with XRE-family HTH domain